MQVQENDKVLIIFSKNLDKEIIEKYRSLVGQNGEIVIENVSKLAELKSDDKQSALSENVLNEIMKNLKLNGRFFIKKSTTEDCSTAKLISELKLMGFVKIDESASEIISYKPNYEIGSSVKLSFAGKPSTKIWQLHADGLVDNDDDLIDDNALLDEEDLKKPDPESLRVCGTTGKRKACANCSCGLAEELNEELRKNTDNAKSSCGNCYLGDAFRCASCPYMGMPAFKPGEKVVLDNSSDL